jgi:hypothetical protein
MAVVVIRFSAFPMGTDLAIRGTRETVDPEEEEGRKRARAPSMCIPTPAPCESPGRRCKHCCAGGLIAQPSNCILEILHLVSRLDGVEWAVLYGEWGAALLPFQRYV